MSIPLKSRRRIRLLAVGCLAVCNLTAAPLLFADNVRNVINRFIEKIGGEEAIRKHQSVRIVGQWTMPERELNGAFELQGAAPNRRVMRVYLGPIGELRSGYDGKIAWSISPLTGATLLKGAARRQAEDDANFFSALHEPAAFGQGTYLGETKFDGRTCHQIEWVRPSGARLTEFYDVKSGFLAGNRRKQVDVGGKATEVTIAYRNYQKFGDLYHATEVYVTSPPLSQVLRVTNVTYDDISASAFDLPPEILKLRD
jgi:hypothetical protein